MDFGLFLMGQVGCWEDAVIAEQHGFASIGMVDSQLLGGETFACLALTAQATRTIQVGTFLAVPHNRAATVAAQGIATINRLAPGRTYFATGTGYTSRNVMGLGPLPAQRMRRYAEDVRKLLNGEEINLPPEEGSPPIRFRQAADEYIDLEHHVPVYVAGDGPRALRAVGESGEGWVTTLQRAHVMSPQAIDVFEESFAAVREAARAAGRDREDWHTVLANTACVLRPGEKATDDRVLGRVGPCAMLAFHTAAQNEDLVDTFPPDWRDRFALYKRRVLSRFDPKRLHQEVHRGHLSYLLDGEAEVLTEDIIRGTTLTGTREELIAHLGALSEVGLRNVTLNFPTGLNREGVAEVARELQPALAG